MKSAWLAGLLLVTVWLQVGFLGAWRPLGILPNLLMVVIIFAGLVRGATETVAMGAAGGLLLDLASGSDFGLRMGFYTVLALVVVVMRQTGANLENLSLVWLITAVGTLVYNLAVLVGVWSAGATVPLNLAGRRIGIEMVMNLILATLLRPVLIRLLRSSANLPIVGGNK